MLAVADLVEHLVAPGIVALIAGAIAAIARMVPRTSPEAAASLAAALHDTAETIPRYVQRIDELEAENAELRAENGELRRRLHHV